jgi:hypothetical protein
MIRLVSMLDASRAGNTGAEEGDGADALSTTVMDVLEKTSRRARA